MKDLLKANKKFRPEIEGLRTIAILLVVIYHIWLGRVSGGIDIFFVLSGFLITMSLISRVERNGTVGVFSFILRIIKRLLPQALLVIIVTMIVGIYILPQTQWTNLSEHFVASIFYFENWRLAVDAVDYLAQGQQVSPFQHFWSLSVQVQIYFIWSLLVLIGYFVLSKFFNISTRYAMLILLVTTFVASISYSIYETYTNQAWAYFDTFARLWEFSIGGLLALILPYLVLNKWLNTVLGWLGLVVICVTGIAIQVSTVFPGYMALVPIGGALLILVASENSTKLGVDRFLSLKLLTVLGGLSYGIYLWHWPLLRFYLSYFETTEVSIVHGCLILVVTILLAYVSTNLVEKPIRQLEGKKKYKTSLALVAIFGLALISSNSFANKQMSTIVLQASAENYIGAAAIYDGAAVIKEVGYMPTLMDVVDDVPSFYNQPNCFAFQTPEVIKCSFGATENPDYTVALVGGSHSGHWFPALEVLAQDMNFQIDLYNHDGCRFTVKDETFKLKEDCLDWNENLIEHLKVDVPDLVFTTSTINKRDKVPEGYLKQWAKLEGITTIFAIRDNPRMKESVPTCLEREENPTNCSRPKADALSEVAPWKNTDNIPSNVIFGDLSDYFCDEEVCHSVIGNVIVYRDQHHITATYAKTLAPVLKPLLEDAFSQL